MVFSRIHHLGDLAIAGAVHVSEQEHELNVVSCGARHYGSDAASGGKSHS